MLEIKDGNVWRCSKRMYFKHMATILNGHKDYTLNNKILSSDKWITIRKEVIQ